MGENIYKYQSDLFQGIEDFIKNQHEAFKHLKPEESWEVFKKHPFTKAIMDTAVNQYMLFNHII